MLPSWCLTGVAFMPPLPRLFESTGSTEYTQVPSNANAKYSLMFWTIDSKTCLKSASET